MQNLYVLERREIMKRKYVLLSSLLVFAVLVVSPVFAVAPTIPPLMERLDAKYHRINLLVPSGFVFSESETTFVMHGWVTGGPEGEIPEWLFWSEMTPAQKVEFLKTACFELFIDSAPIELRRFQWYDHGIDGMYVVYWTVFPSHTFTAGSEYIFEGIWSVEYNGEQYTHTEMGVIVPY